MHDPAPTSTARPRLGLVRLLAVALSAVALLAAINTTAARADAVQYTSHVTAGGYRTLDRLWNTTASAGFSCPRGAQIRVIYGYGWLSFTRQNQTLDCQSFKTLSVGGLSKIGARIQIKVLETGYVNWTYGFEG